MKALRSSVLALCLGVGLSGCGGGGGGSGGSKDPVTPIPGGETPSTPAGGDTNVVRGVVMDSASGQRLAGVAVSGGGVSAETDASGEYSLSLASSDQPVTLSFNKADYAPGFDNVLVKNSSDALLVALKKQGELQDYRADTSKTIYQTTEAGPYAVIFKPNTLNSTDTDLRVSVTPLDPTIEGDVLPGELGSSGAMLNPLTFAEFTILDAAGQHVNLLPGSEAIVELPIPPSLRDRPEYALGQTIHCYSFNPLTGQWEDFVVGVVALSSVDGVTPVVRATVKHFSWYGAAPDTDECEWVVGTIVSAVDGRPLAGARVEAFPGTVTRSDSNGNFQVVSSKGSSPEIVATRTYTDTDGSLSGMPGAKIIEFGKAKVNDLLYPLVPCEDALGGGAAGISAAASPAADQPRVTVPIGVLTDLNYTASAYLSDESIIVTMNLLLPDGEDGGVVGDAVLTLTDTQGTSIKVPELGADVPESESSGIYMTELTVVPGERYDLTIDVDNNGTIDGSGSVYAVGNIEWANPVEGGAVSASSFTAQWTDSAAGMSGYNPIYWAFISPENGSDIPYDGLQINVGHYLGSDRSFDVRTYDETKAPLEPGNYTAQLAVFSGAAGLGNADFEVTNNISGSLVNGIFWSLKVKAIEQLTITP